MMVRELHSDSAGRLTDRTFLDDRHLQRLLTVLNADGEEARVVGGAVRNALLGAAPGDVDVTTTALPEVVVARCKAARLRTIPTGISHGTVTVVVAGQPYEVTTLREDVETDGRHAVVRFGRDFATDALRRDFTINALSVEADGLVHDYADGLPDLRAGRVRYIGDPRIRIREDFLRILRFFRFSASYAVGPFDTAGLESAGSEAAGLARLSRERVRSEVMKLLVAPRAADAVAAMEAVGILASVIGTECWPERLARYRSIMLARPAEPDPLLGLAALAVRSESAPARLRDSLRLSNDERNRLERLATRIAAGPPAAAPDAHTLSSLLFAEGRQTAVDAVTLWHVDSFASPRDPAWLAAARFASIATVPALPVSGADIMARGISSGPLVGRVLKQLQALWITAGFPDSPAVLHRLLDEAIDTSRDTRAGN